MRFGTPTSALTAAAAAIAFLAPFAAAAAAAVPAPVPAPAPTGVDSAPGAMPTALTVTITSKDAAGEETVRYLYLERSENIDRANKDIVSNQWTAEMGFTSEEAVDIRSLSYSTNMAYPWLDSCYAVFDDGVSKELGKIPVNVEAPTRVTCAVIQVESFMDKVFARALNLPSEGGGAGFLEKIGF